MRLNHYRSAGKTKRRLGFSLVEVALSLGIAGLALVAMEQGADDANRQIKDAAAADRITQVYDAAEQYLQANPGLAGTMTVGTPVQLAVGRTSATGAIPSPSLQSLGFLPANYIDSNPYGQTHLVVLRAEANNLVEALVQTVGGTTIPDVDLGRISAKVGANGGVVDSTPPPGIAAGTMQGTGGGWSEAAADWTAGSVTPSAGHALAVNYVTQTNVLQPWLYRNVVPGQPEANRMHTNIDMTHNALNAVATINNTDQTSGAVGVITVGSTLEGTTNTPVTFNNGISACVGDATGCAVRVSDDGEFVDNNDGWITYEGSGSVAGTGLLIAGAGDNLQVNGATTMQGVATANGGLIAQQYIQSYGNVELKRTATHLAALTWPDTSGNWSGGAYLEPDTSTAAANLLHLYGGSLTVDGNLAAGNSVTSYDMFSRIYYDSSNSAYYMEPAGTSNLNAVYANLVDDSGQLIGGGGVFNVYPSGGAWYLYMGGQINATGSIGAGGNVSATGNVTAGQAVDAGNGITASNGNITASNGAVSASTTVTGGTGVVTNGQGQAGGSCPIDYMIGHDISTQNLIWCHNYVWQDETPFSTTVANGATQPLSAVSGNQEVGAYIYNDSSSPELVTIWTSNTCLEAGISATVRIVSAGSTTTVGGGEGLNVNATFVVPAYASWESSDNYVYDQAATCAIDLTTYYTAWR